MTIYVLTKGRSATGKCTLHGITTHFGVAEAWETAGPSNTYTPFDEVGENFTQTQLEPWNMAAAK